MPLPLFLPCAAGVEALLAEEVARVLPETSVRAARGGIALAGDPHEVMVLNLESRLAQRVLIEVAEGPYRDENDLYALAHGVAWSDWITPRQTLRVDSTSQRSPLKSLNFAALRVKDAVCDRMRDEHGERPNVDTVRPDLQIVLHAGAERAAVYVDSSGESLFKRGWRE
ncbi:MAG TPA: THUMP domain-containing protein, partial [Caldimonas sp.]|nr:THUMP domain-containing protein [Caldimonas sp.]